MSKNNKNKIDRQFHLPRKMFLGGFNIATLIFSSLIINIFSLAVPMMTLQVYDRILAFYSIGTLQVLCAGVTVIVVLDAILKITRSSLIGWISARFEYTANTKALRHLMGAKLPHIQKTSEGEMLHRLASISKLKSFYSGQSLINLIDMPFVFIFLGFITYLSGWLVIVPLSLLVVFGFYAAYLGKKIKTALEMRDQEDDARVNFVSEILSHIHTVKMLGLESAFQRKHEALQGDNALDAHALNTHNAQAVNAAALFTQIMMVSMISIGAMMVLDGQITMGILIACVLLSGRIMQPVQRALSFWISYQEFQLAQNKIGQIFSLPLQEKMPSNTLGDAKGKLEIKDLEFSHEQSPALFHDLNLTLTLGKIIALSGPAGDGKSTFLKLIAGLYEPNKGEVLIDGIDICKYPFSDIARYVGYLPSEAQIFQGTIMENLTSFRPDLEDQAIEISLLLGIDTVVSKLSKGYQTVLFDGAADPVTPGMKQRITIARVLVNRPRLLLFDYADKSLDKEGYNHVFRLLGKLKGQASMILVSNDRNILHLAQEEYVVEGGRLVAIDDSQFSKSNQVEQPLKELQA